MTPAPASTSSQAHDAALPAAAEVSRIKLRLCYHGTFKQASDMQWVYASGQYHNESVAATCKYADFMYKLTEKFKMSISVKYQPPGEEMDPDNLINVQDDGDLQEMFEEYYNQMSRQGSNNKTFRIKVFMFDAAEEPYTVEQLLDMDAFARHGQFPSAAVVDHSSWGSNTSSNLFSTSQNELDSLHSLPRHSNVLSGDFSGAVAVLAPKINSPNRLGVPVSVSALQLSEADNSPTEVYAASILQSRVIWEGGAPGTVLLRNETGTPVAAANSVEDQQHTQIGIGDGLPSHITEFGDTSFTPAITFPSHLGSACGDNSLRASEQHELLEGDNITDASNLGSPTSQQLAFISQASGYFPGADVSVEGAPRRPHSPPAGTPAGGGFLERAGSGGKQPKKVDEVYRFPRSEVTILRKIGEGAFGEVHLAKCQLFDQVAVKWVKPDRLQKAPSSAKRFWEEANTLKELNHPNVLRFYGVVTETGAAGCHQNEEAVVGIITEYVSGGSLAQYIRNIASASISLRLRCDLAYQIANGMAYLHHQRIVHFDLKPDNLLLENDGAGNLRLKVADFGLSKHKCVSYVSGCKDLRGTLPYMAPELISDPQHVTEKADVWSMGVVLWEMYTLEVPYQDLSPQAILSGLMKGSLRPGVPPGCEPEWDQLLTLCLDAKPSRRPSFRDLASFIERIRDQLGPASATGSPTLPSSGGSARWAG